MPLLIALLAAATILVGQEPPTRRAAPMPMQKQSLDYFAGKWSFKRLGAESEVAPGPGAGTLTFTILPDGKLQGVTELMVDGPGMYTENISVTFDAAKNILTWSEQRPGGVKVIGSGDWSSPLAIRFKLEPIKLKTGTYEIRRVISILSATSFSMTEEVSVNGGPFVRLGNAVYTKQ